jgi:hypothetical protein
VRVRISADGTSPSAPAPPPRHFVFHLDTDAFAPEFRRGMDLIIEPDREACEGSIVLLQLRLADGMATPVLGRWQRTWLNEAGRRVRAGGGRETFNVGRVSYTLADVEQGKVKILGVVGGWLRGAAGRS